MAEKLTPEQVDECKEIFDLFDADEDGKSPSPSYSDPPRAPSIAPSPQLTCACFFVALPVAVGMQVASPRASS